MITAYAQKGIIEANELATILENNEPVKLIDGSYGPAAQTVFRQNRIDNAVYFDIDEIADPAAPLPHTVPAPQRFEEAVSALGISNDDFIVVYDQSGIAMAASRVWWMFRLFGHDNICVLNGGLPYWQANGYTVNTTPCTVPAPAEFKASYRPELIKLIGDMQEISNSKASAILDARSAERFTGAVRESGPGLRSGHIPGSANLPYADLIDENGRLRNRETIKEHLAPYLQTNIVSTCGSGVTACVIALACHVLGKTDVPVYDGSWTEWGQDNNRYDISRQAESK